MGRLFDAMAKVGGSRERVTREPNDDAHYGLRNGSPHQAEDEAAERFDFIGYSLNPNAAVTIGPAVAGRDGHAPARPAGAPIVPAQKIELDLGRLDPHLVTLSECDPAAAKQYHALAASLITAAVDRPLKRVLIASALHGDGRTCVTLNLAGALALARRRVLVVDTDLLRPAMLRLLGMGAEAGLAEAVTGAVPAAEAVCQVSPAGFHILPSRGQVENAAELLASANFGQLLDELDHQYDFILFDSAPLLVTGDAHLLLPFVDNTLLVVAPGRCTSAQAAQAVERIATEDIFGVVLNRANE